MIFICGKGVLFIFINPVTPMIDHDRVSFYNISTIYNKVRI